MTPDEKRAYELARINKRRHAAKEKLGGACSSCGVLDHLEFDHINRETKSCNVSNLWTATDARFWAEVAKCQLLCRDCHKKKSLLSGDLTPMKHGHRMYRKGCRCSTCVEVAMGAQKKYKQKYLARKKAGLV